MPVFIWTIVTRFHSPGGFICHKNVFITVQEAKVYGCNANMVGSRSPFSGLQTAHYFFFFFVCLYCGKSIVEHAGHFNKEQILLLSTSLRTNCLPHIHPKPLGPEVSTYDLGDNRNAVSVVMCALAIWYCLAFCQGGRWSPRMDMCQDVKVSKQSCR